MAARRDLPDIMGEAFGRLDLAGSPQPRGKLFSLPPEPAPGPSPREVAQRLAGLRLEGMASRLLDQSRRPEARGLGFVARLEDLLQAEEARRRQRLLEDRLQRAGLAKAPPLEEVDCARSGGPEPAAVARLARPDWLKTPRNLVFHGPTGVGKTFLATALGREMILQGFRVVYGGAARLTRELARASSLASQTRALRALVRADLLIIDDLGLAQLDQDQMVFLHEVVEQRMNRRATLTIAALPPEAWPARLGGGGLGVALTDRLDAGGWRVAWSGPSRRGRG